MPILKWSDLFLKIIFPKYVLCSKWAHTVAYKALKINFYYSFNSYIIVWELRLSFFFSAQEQNTDFRIVMLASDYFSAISLHFPGYQIKQLVANDWYVPDTHKGSIHIFLVLYKPERLTSRKEMLKLCFNYRTTQRNGFYRKLAL